MSVINYSPEIINKIILGDETTIKSYLMESFKILDINTNRKLVTSLGDIKYNKPEPRVLRRLLLACATVNAHYNLIGRLLEVGIEPIQRSEYWTSSTLEVLAHGMCSECQWVINNRPEWLKSGGLWPDRDPNILNTMLDACMKSDTPNTYLVSVLCNAGALTSRLALTRGVKLGSVDILKILLTKLLPTLESLAWLNEALTEDPSEEITKQIENKIELISFVVRTLE